MTLLDALLLVVLSVGLALSLPIWWWLYVTPILRLWRRLAGPPKTRSGTEAGTQPKKHRIAFRFKRDPLYCHKNR